MKLIEKIIFTIISIVTDPKTALEELKQYGGVVSKKAAPFICAGLFGVLVTLCGFRAEQAKPTYAPIYIPEEIEEEVPVQEPAISEEEQLLMTEAEYCAKVLYGTAQYNSEAGQKLVVWCIVNRVENERYPNTVEEVCRQDKQWMGYSDDNPVLTSLYDISMEVLQKWHNGQFRDVSPDFIFMTWSSKEIILKDRFEDGTKTHYWYE